MYYKTKLSGNFFYLWTVLLLTILLYNCSDNEIDKPDVGVTELNDKNQRVNFANYEEFRKTVNELSNLSSDELEQWIIKNNTNSLYNYLKNDEVSSDYLNNLLDAHKAIFNKDSEVIISDKIIWVYDEMLYEFNMFDDIESLKTKKTKVNELTPVGSIKISFLDKGNSSNGSLSSRVSIGQDQYEARHQIEFIGSYFYDCSGNYNNQNLNHRYRYIHELVTVQTRFGNAGDSKLYLRIKYIWRARKYWHPGGEPRDFNININLSGTYLAFSNGVILSTSGANSVSLNYTCSGDKTILLKSSQSYGLEGGAPYWSVQSTGTINHQLHGGTHAWSNNFLY